MQKYIFLVLLLFSLKGFSQKNEDDSSQIVRLLKSDYATMQDWNVSAHIANCTPDYLLIENGEVWDLEREVESYKENANNIVDRKDYFDIKTVKIVGQLAYEVHTLKSVFTKNNDSTTIVWNESVIFRKIHGLWKIALIHSTPIMRLPDPNFDHVALFVRDIKTSATFYQTLFHLDTIPVPAHGNTSVIWFAINKNLQLHLVEGLKDTVRIPFTHIAFSVLSIDAFIERLNYAHIAYFSGKGKNTIDLRADGVHQIYFKDPDGYEIEVNDRKQ